MTVDELSQECVLPANCCPHVAHTHHVRGVQKRRVARVGASRKSISLTHRQLSHRPNVVAAPVAKPIVAIASSFRALSTWHTCQSYQLVYTPKACAPQWSIHLRHSERPMARREALKDARQWALKRRSVVLVHVARNEVEQHGERGSVGDWRSSSGRHSSVGVNGDRGSSSAGPRWQRRIRSGYAAARGGLWCAGATVCT